MTVHIDTHQPQATELIVPDENALEELSEADALQMKTLLLDLLHMDRLARQHGHSLTDVLAKAARDQYGIDIRPDHDRNPSIG